MEKIYDFPVKFDTNDKVLQFQPICLEDITSISPVESSYESYAVFCVFSKYSSFEIAFREETFANLLHERLEDVLKLEREKLVSAWKEFKKN